MSSNYALKSSKVSKPKTNSRNAKPETSEKIFLFALFVFFCGNISPFIS
jgi:hypothetical protein